MNMSKIGKFEWLVLYAITGIIDLIQVVISLTGIGIAVNEIADPIIGIILLGYFEIRGVSLITKPARLISLLGILGLETFTGGIAPAWIVDIWYIHSSVKREDQAKEESMVNLFQNNIRNPVYQNGTRPPRIDTPKNKPLNVDGVRPPKLKT